MIDQKELAQLMSKNALETYFSIRDSLSYQGQQSLGTDGETVIKLIAILRESNPQIAQHLIDHMVDFVEKSVGEHQEMIDIVKRYFIDIPRNKDGL